MKETVAMLNQQYVMPNGLTPYAGVTAKSPWLASESEKRQRKICDSLETAIRRSGLQNGMTISDLPDGEIEIGMGQHGEGGGGCKQLVSADETAEEMIGLLMKKLQPKAGNKVLLIINGVGATTHMEMNIVYRKAHQVLENAGIEVAAARIGELLTVQEQAGFQMILGLLDDDHIDYLNNKMSNAPYWTTIGK